jgi:probable rRNA maturation factor
VPITIDVQYASGNSDIPDKKKLTRWAEACLESFVEDAELTIRIVGEEEISRLNKTWRGFDMPTNVLSFPAGGNEIVPQLLGDVVICAPIINKEASEQNKTLDAHWAHMVIHGILHLMGYDHTHKHDAEEMEALEIKKLKLLKYPDPYK